MYSHIKSSHFSVFSTDRNVGGFLLYKEMDAACFESTAQNCETHRNIKDLAKDTDVPKNKKFTFENVKYNNATYN